MHSLRHFILIFSLFFYTLYATAGYHPGADTGASTPYLQFVVHDEHAILAKQNYSGVQKEDLMANVFFDRDAFRIDTELPANQIPFVKHQLELLFQPLETGWLPDTVVITSYTSPEGDSLYNAALAKKRSAAGASYVSSMFTAILKDKPSCTILTETGGEDWDGLVKTLRASDLAGRDEIIHIIDNQDFTDTEIMEQLQRSSLYPILKDNFYPLLRRISIRISYHEPLKTDEELLVCALENHQFLHFNQIMYAATLTDDPAKKMEIYRSASARYPEEWKAYNNIACLYLDLDEPEQAMVYLNSASNLFPSNGTIFNNLAAASLKMNRADKALHYLDLAQKEEVDVSYNYGIYYLLTGDYGKAFSQLESYPCNINAALAALMANQPEKAGEILACSPETATRHYLLALYGAKTNNEAEVASELVKALQLDSSLAVFLRNDHAFLPYKSMEWFQRILRQ
ncbi:MAG: hypothetical protein PHD61_12230 [Bacteroidales bacterium]|nr:hypothetical protein [Lentimicrobiaceae bacterium]MDD5696055.1 hypothetical protein [Bacteroidales bacterium]